MSKIYKVNINPDVLVWARLQSGEAPEQIAERLSVELELYRAWESDGLDVPLGKLKVLAARFKRQVAFFFLTEVPPSPKTPTDYRNLKIAHTSLSREVRLAIRRANVFQSTAAELKEEGYWDRVYGWEAGRSELLAAEDQIIAWLRDALGITIEEQMFSRDAGTAFRNWRNAVEEKLGILVFQFQMPPREVQAFCLTGLKPYVIVVNNRLPYTSRIFSLFHELGHIFRRRSGLCLVEDFEHQGKEERACNRFAGDFLLPAESMQPITDFESLKELADLFRVSREAYLHRLYELKLIRDVAFFKMLERLRNSYTLKTSTETEVKIAREIISQSSRGLTFYNIVLDGLRENRIRLGAASSLLGLRGMTVVNEL